MVDGSGRFLVKCPFEGVGFISRCHVVNGNATVRY